MKRIFPKTFYNTTTLLGAAVALTSFGLVLFLMVLDYFSPEHKSYVGIITFVILPMVLLLGLAVAAAGVMREHRREKRGLPAAMRLPRIDLNDARQRTAVFSIAFGALLLLIFSAFGSYKAYEYTDSDDFCGTICHKVMKPEYTAYQNSPHAHVGCAKCHIGPGAGWFVRSKLSGAYQVYSVLFNKYARPIATPIENLRPAQETCEQCHWPKHFFSEMLVSKTYFLTDETNTRSHLDLLMKVGGGDEAAGLKGGIHWSMNIANEITYAPMDRQRQVIPWIKVKSRKDGTEHIYRSTEIAVSDSALATLEKRTMDCIDCHNRPSHIYHPPAPTIDHAMETGLIDTTLPFSKSAAMKAMDETYSSSEIARDSIRISIEEFYAANYPKIAADKRDAINRMVAAVQNEYALNNFPGMGVNWRHFPNNIGHLYYSGCFRCHDGKHVSDEGKVLSRDCNVCHTLLAQQSGSAVRQVSLNGVEFQHPADVGTAWKENSCIECHNAQ